MKASITLSCVVVVLITVHSVLGAETILDPSFNPGTGANGLAESTVIQNDGKILICGNFTTFNGSAHAYIARLHPDGSIDDSFNPDVGYWVRHMALQSDGKIVIGGFFTDVQGISRNRIARLNTDGTLDTDFNPGTGCRTKIVPPDPWDPFVFAVAVQPDGKILIGGNFVSYNGTTNVGIVRVNSNGSLDSTFHVGQGVNSWVRSILVQGNGQIMLTGWFTSYDNHPHSRMVLLNEDGSDVRTFSPEFGELTAVYTVAQLGSGKYIAAGHCANTNNPGYWEREMARLNPDGSFDTSFQGYANEKVESIKIQADGKIVMGGYFSHVNGVRRENLARLNEDGSLDETFAPFADNYVWTVALQNDGRILATGGFDSIDGTSRKGIVRFAEAGSSNAAPPTILVAQTAGSRTALLSGTTHLTATLLNGGRPLNPHNHIAAVNDFNNDGKQDFLWQQNTSGALSVWFMDGTNHLGSAVLSNQAAIRGWRVATSGDFNADGKTDVVLQKGAEVRFWFLNGTNVESTTALKMRGPTWRVVGAGDFDQDGHTDLLWTHPARYLSVAHMNGTSVRDSGVLNKRVPGGWSVRAISDFSGDGKMDLLLQSSAGPVAVWSCNDTNFLQSVSNGRLSPAWRVVGWY